MKKSVISFKYKVLQILDESFSGDFYKFGCWQNIYKFMIFIVKTKILVCQCVSPKNIDF